MISINLIDWFQYLISSWSMSVIRSLQYNRPWYYKLCKRSIWKRQFEQQASALQVSFFSNGWSFAIQIFGIIFFFSFSLHQLPICIAVYSADWICMELTMSKTKRNIVFLDFILVEICGLVGRATTFVGGDVGLIPTCCALEVWQWIFGSITVCLGNNSAGQPQFILEIYGQHIFGDSIR